MSFLDKKQAGDEAPTFGVSASNNSSSNVADVVRSSAPCVVEISYL